MAQDRKQAQVQTIRISYTFEDPSNPEISQTNEHVWTDSPAMIKMVQAVAIVPGFELMLERFNEMNRVGAIGRDPSLQAFIDSFKS